MSKRGFIFTLEMALVIALLIGMLGVVLPMLKIPQQSYSGGYERALLAVIEKGGHIEECVQKSSCGKLEELLEAQGKCIELKMIEYDKNGVLKKQLGFQAGECPVNADRIVSASRVSWRDHNTYVSRVKVSR